MADHREREPNREAEDHIGGPGVKAREHRDTLSQDFLDDNGAILGALVDGVKQKNSPRTDGAGAGAGRSDSRLLAGAYFTPTTFSPMTTARMTRIPL